MVAVPKRTEGLFSGWIGESIDDQLQRAGWRKRVYVGGDHEYLCAACVARGEGGFTCALCGQKRQLRESYRSFGGPPEHLCVTCYETVSAKVWEQTIEQLREAHRYDYE